MTNHNRTITIGDRSISRGTPVMDDLLEKTSVKEPQRVVNGGKKGKKRFKKEMKAFQKALKKDAYKEFQSYRRKDWSV